MKFINFYKEILGCNNEDDVFNYLIDNLKPSITTWSYFVNWDKVSENTKKIEVALNSLNYLIGKTNFDEEFKALIKRNTEVVKVIPSLVVRDGDNTGNFNILLGCNNGKLVYENCDFTKKEINDDDIEKYLTFIKETGLKDLIVSQKIKNFTDYMIGVEAGLDSNGRKNRGGHSMEGIVESFIADFCKAERFEYLKEANAAKIKQKWGIDVPVDKSSRRYDYVVNNGKELIIFETNFYGGGGSKLKSTAGEYRNLFDVLEGKFKFIWITDGKGWIGTTRPLRETFEHNDYIFNLKMIEEGVLNYISNK